MKYRKKPVVVEAIQWKPFEMTLWDVVDHFGLDRKEARIYYSPDYYYACLEIKTLEGYMTVRDGDYIIRGVQGEFYSCKPDIFEQTYELVEEQEK